MTILAIVEKGNDGLYSIYSEDEILSHGLGGYGSSVEEAKKDFFVSINEAKEMVVEEGKVLPKGAENVEVTFKYDLQSFFNFFDWVNVSKFAKLAGVNASQMRQYKQGLSFASEKTTQKILDAVKKVGTELASATL